MKKILSTLTAAALLCGMTAMPVSAEETEYRMGDVNMDGKIGADDAQLLLLDYVQNICAHNPAARTLTEEQIQLGNVDRYSWIKTMFDGCVLDYTIDVRDAQIVLRYYLATQVNPAVLQTDIITWAIENNFDINQEGMS